VTDINLKAYGNLKRHLGITGGTPRIFHTWIQVPEIEAAIAERFIPIPSPYCAIRCHWGFPMWSSNPGNSRHNTNTSDRLGIDPIKHRRAQENSDTQRI
jgi:hypothetical protein